MQGLSVSVTVSRLREFLEQLPQTNFRKKFQSRLPIYGPVNIKNAQYFKKVKKYAGEVGGAGATVAGGADSGRHTHFASNRVEI